MEGNGSVSGVKLIKGLQCRCEGDRTKVAAVVVMVEVTSL